MNDDGIQEELPFEDGGGLGIGAGRDAARDPDAPPISEADLAEFTTQLYGDEAPTFHTILEVWREVLRPAADPEVQEVTASWAARIVAQFGHLQIKVQEMPAFRDSYYAKLAQLNQILLNEIATDDECLNRDTPQEDAVENAQHYRNLLLNWQLAILSWELAWEPTDPLAHVEIAAISEAHKLFFGQNGLAGYLDNIGFEFTETDQAELATALAEAKEGS